jgi:nucleotide-binding universal stress UspA family protein
MGSYRKIVVGTDGSDTAMRAVARAGAVAGDSHAELLIVTAYEPASREEVRAAADALKQDAFLVVGSAPAESLLRDAVTHAALHGADDIDTLAVAGPPVEVLDKAVANAHADLVVVGNVGLNTLTGRILGSVPENVARRAGVDVLIVHTS